MMEIPDLLLMFEWLVNRGPTPVDEVCSRFGVDRATLERNIDTLATVGEAPFTPDSLLFAFIDDEADTVSVEPFEGLEKGVSLDRDVARQIFTMAEALTRLPGFETVPAIASAANKLGEQLAKTGVDVRALKAHLDVPGSEFVAPLRVAILDRRRVKLVYRAASSLATSAREVDPIGLLYERTGWYLEAFDHQRSDQVLFRLDRMEDLEVTDQEFSTTAKRSARIEVDPGSDATRVVLECGPESMWLTERLAGADVQRTDSGAILALEASGINWLVPLVMAAGPQVRIVEPDSLRTLVIETAQAARAKYR